MLSIIQQLIDDKSEIVREALARNLGLLVSYVEDHEKVSQVQIHLLFVSLAGGRSASCEPPFFSSSL